MNGNNRPPSSVLGLGTSARSNTAARLAHTEDCPCQTGPQSPEHVLQLCPLFREAGQDYRPQSHVLQLCLLFGETRQYHSPMFYSSTVSSEKPDRTTVPCSTVLPSLQRSQTGPQSHVLQFCLSSEKPDRTTVPCSTVLSLFRETRQDRSPMFYSSAPSSE